MVTVDASTREEIAVGTAEDGTAVFHELAIPAGIRRLMSERRREPLGKSVPPIVPVKPLPSAFVRELLTTNTTEEV